MSVKSRLRNRKRGLRRVGSRDRRRRKRSVFKRDGYRCVYCGSTDNLTLDHVVPVAAGGHSRISNLVTACEPCNTLKADTLPEVAA